MNEHGLGGEYPADWSHFVGQDQVKRQLMLACRSAKSEGRRLDHVLLASGIPGIGKTSLALLCAQELGSQVKVISGRIGVNEARIALADLNDGDVLIYDEAHLAVAGNSANAGWLLHLLQDGVIMGPMGPEEQPDITVIAVTTDAGRLTRPILERFFYKPVLSEYSREQAGLIGAEFAIRLFQAAGLPLPTEENLLAVADAANRRPRLMRAILGNLRDIAAGTSLSNYTEEAGYDLTEALGWLGLSPDGLDRTMRRYLIALLKDFAGGAGEKALVDRLQEPGGLADVEQVLRDKGLLALTKSGRVLTGTGIRTAKALAADPAAA